MPTTKRHTDHILENYTFSRLTDFGKSPAAQDVQGKNSHCSAVVQKTHTVVLCRRWKKLTCYGEIRYSKDLLITGPNFSPD